MKKIDFFLIFTTFAWEGQNGHFQINLTANLTDFDGNGNEGSVNYSDGGEGSSKVSMAGKNSNDTEEIGSLILLEYIFSNTRSIVARSATVAELPDPQTLAELLEPELLQWPLRDMRRRSGTKRGQSR